MKTIIIILEIMLYIGMFLGFFMAGNAYLMITNQESNLGLLANIITSFFMTTITQYLMIRRINQEVKHDTSNKR